MFAVYVLSERSERMTIDGKHGNEGSRIYTTQKTIAYELLIHGKLYEKNLRFSSVKKFSYPSVARSIKIKTNTGKTAAGSLTFFSMKSFEKFTC